MLCSDGYNYDEMHVREWLNAGNRTSPMTGMTLSNLYLKPNVELKGRIAAWKAKRDRARMK